MGVGITRRPRSTDPDSCLRRTPRLGPAPTRRYTSHVVETAGGHRVAKPYVRLTQPLVRDTKGGDLRPASWDEALARTVAGFQAAKAAHGPTTFGTFSCSKATNEVNFAAQKFSRTVLGSNNIDSCNRT
jgi:predicted molibdopterin-dependent oxidoreductase YjgC